MPQLGVPELLIILVIVLLLFGAGRIRGVAGALGGSIKEFRRSVRDEDPNAAANAAAAANANGVEVERKDAKE